MARKKPPTAYRRDFRKLIGEITKPELPIQKHVVSVKKYLRALDKANKKQQLLNSTKKFLSQKSTSDIRPLSEKKEEAKGFVVDGKTLCFYAKTQNDGKQFVISFFKGVNENESIEITIEVA